MKGRHYLLLVLAIVCAGIYTVGKLWPLSPLADFGCNVSAGFFGLFLTVLLVDRAIAAERARETARLRGLAFGQLRREFERHVLFLWNLYRASATSKPAKEPATLAEIFTEDYFQTVRHLDFSRTGPSKVPPQTWFTYAADAAMQFRDALRRVADRYVSFLSVDAMGFRRIDLSAGLEHTEA